MNSSNVLVLPCLQKKVVALKVFIVTKVVALKVFIVTTDHAATINTVQPIFIIEHDPSTEKKSFVSF